MSNWETHLERLHAHLTAAIDGFVDLTSFGCPDDVWCEMGHRGDDRCERCKAIRDGIGAWNECGRVK